jgi:glycine/D-amino acid oxidase-like deaminating enzyme
MGMESIKQWQQIEKQAQTQLYYQTGGLDFGFSDDSNLNEVISVAKKSGFDIEELNEQELKQRFPLMTGLPDNYKGCLQPNAGIINAQKAVDAFQQLVKSSKRVQCDIHENEKLVSVKDEQDHVVITTDKATYTAGKVVLTSGAWISEIVKKNFDLELDTVVKRVSYYFWKVNEQYHDQFQKMPIFIHWGYDPYSPEFREIDPGYYGFGMFEKPGYIKIGIHDVLEEEKNVVLDERATSIRSGTEFPVPERKIELMRKFATSLYHPAIEYESIEDMKKNGSIVTCLYTCTPGNDFILDKIPHSNNVISK